ncbi:MAG: lantibiotic ABC transporter permease [Spirochaetae bacterium HGW-Spirochaetae-9]|nr:MAG: lantibiotic ABC transporter permease [Spirochaetae bacterium HGW-Spirochaetae-9]
MATNLHTNTAAATTLKALSIIAAISFLAVVAINGMANALPLNGVNTGQLSDEIPNLFVPAGLTFSIWGLIYLLLVGYSAAIVREGFRAGKASAWTTRDAGLFIINMAANVGWIFAWHWRLVGIAMVLMLVILGTLIALEQLNQAKLASGGALDASLGAAVTTTRSRAFFLTVPLRVYLGWISVATIANVTALLVSLGWGGFGISERFWTVLVIAAGLAVALGFSVWKRQVAAPLVVVWAYAGIVLKRFQESAQGEPLEVLVASAAGVAAAIILVSFAYGRIACPFRPKKA